MRSSERFEAMAWRSSSDSAGENPAGVAQDGQARQHDEGSEEFRSEDELDRIDRHSAERVDFFGHHHGADLGGKRGSGASAHSDRGEQRPKLPGKTNGYEVGDELHRTEAAQFGGALHGQNESCTTSHDAHHGNRGEADREHLLNGRKPSMPISDRRKCFSQRADRLAGLNDQVADIFKLAQHGSSGPI